MKVYVCGVNLPNGFMIEHVYHNKEDAEEYVLAVVPLNHNRFYDEMETE